MTLLQALPAEAQRVLDFWFGAPGSAQWNTTRKAWFTKSASFDASVRAALLPLWEAVRAGAHDDWALTPLGACARIVVLDQVPRNVFRHDPRSFATDAQALQAARQVVASGADRLLPTPHHRLFCYMPFEHAESRADQAESVRLMRALRDDSEGKVDTVAWALKHQAVIGRFGRFPHRNAVLGRENTPEEAAFLREPGSSF
ncbi:DUF924 family protein [Cupriavidus sp. 2TAF22]|uniref:DUF924 family protein n=1 Tax=unclassified Cupriavidus TaxID=2640874 RepID=UPI003F901011